MARAERPPAVEETPDARVRRFDQAMSRERQGSEDKVSVIAGFIERHPRLSTLTAFFLGLPIAAAGAVGFVWFGIAFLNSLDEPWSILNYLNIALIVASGLVGWLGYVLVATGVVLVISNDDKLE